MAESECEMKRNKKVVVIIFVLLFYILAIVETMNVNNVYTVQSLLKDTAVLEKLYFVVQIITGVGLILGAVIGVWQYYLSTKSEIIKQKTEAVQKSIDLAEYYRANILDLYEALNYVYQETGMNKIIKSINPDKMKEFDEAELFNNLAPQQIEEIRNINRSTDLINALMKMEMVFGVDLGIKSHMRMKKNGEDEEIQINTSAVLRRYGNCIVSEVLNRLEYFAMHFEHNTADETVVYQSLHQTYINLIQLLYFEISCKNSKGHKKYYTNVIGLYNKWFERYKNKRTNSTIKDRQSVTKGTVVNKLN
jgi:hypothetical protein|nr:MAG TPA: hypothetical protein [Caudoviricetes sp.]